MPGRSDDLDSFLRAAAETPHVGLASEFVGTERYQLVRELGEGAFGTVYEAVDLVQGDRVALKALHGARGLLRFKREFRALTQILHPNVVRLYELGATERHWFFTMELVRGLPFDRFVRKHPAELRRVLGQLVEGLHAIHRAGKLHCDVKPANVLVREGGHPVIVDLGLVFDRQIGQSVEIAGTPLYMAPETLAGEEPREASDWYSVGVMLYAALAGRLPFDGTQRELLELKQGGTPAPPSALAPDVPPDLEALCLQLLERDPARRPDGAEILARLNAEARATSAPAAARALFGRERELEALRAAVDQTLRGQRTIALVQGSSGIGKSALIRQLVAEVRRDRPQTLVLSGSCYQHESVPYKALDAIIDELARHLGHLDEQALERLVPGDSAALAQLFPVLRQVPSFRDLQPDELGLDLVERKARGVAALRELFRRVAAERPTLVCVDDLHWGDLESAALLHELVRPPDPPIICFIGSFRAEEAGTSPLLRRLAELRRLELASVEVLDLRLGPLAAETAERLAAELLAEVGRDPGEALALAAESQGSPFFLEELARARSAAPSIEAAVEARIGRLPEPAARLLEAIALIDRPVEERVAAEAAALGPEQRDALALLAAERLVRSRETGAGRQVEVYHARIGAVAAGRITASRPAVQEEVAAALERSGTADAEELLFHFSLAKQSEKAALYAELAAAQAAGSLAFDRAARLYRTAIELNGAGGRRWELKRALADVLVNARRGTEAAQAFSEAAEEAPAAEAIELKRCAAEQFLRSGQKDEGTQLIAELMARWRLGDPRSSAARWAWFLWYRALIALRGTGYRPREAGAIPFERLARIDVLYAASVGLAQVDQARAAGYQVRATLRALRAGEPTRVARALVAEACFVSSAGQRYERRALEVLAAARVAARSAGDRIATAQEILARGFVAYCAGRWREARKLFEEGEVIVRRTCTGMAWELSGAQNYTLDCMVMLGDFESLVRQIPARMRDARARGDRFAITGVTVFGGSATHLAKDDPRAALSEVEQIIAGWSTQRYCAQHFDALYARLNAHLYLDDPAAALDELRRELPALRRSKMLIFPVVRLKKLDAEARAALSLSRRGHEPKRMLRLVAKNAARIAKIDLAHAAPLAQLLQGGVSLHRGDRTAARERFTAAAAGFDEGGMSLHAAAARRAALLVEDGDASGAERRIADQGVAHPARYARMLAPALG